MSDWVPLRLRGGADNADYRGPFEGVPEWLFGPLWSWVVARMPVYDRRGSVRLGAIGDYRDLAMAMRISLETPGDPNPRNAGDMQGNLYDRVLSNKDFLLDVADYLLLRVGNDPLQQPAVGIVRTILVKAGSVWTVGGGGTPRLERRVSDEESASAEAAMAGEGRPAQHLRLAWEATYGRSPDATTAYREAVRAVEAAAAPVVTPQNPKQTLGTMIADMQAKPDKWTVLLGGADKDAAVLEVVGMMGLLWKGQQDRHGTPDESVPIAVSGEEAQAAVQLAVPMVRWFAEGVITQRASGK